VLPFDLLLASREAEPVQVRSREHMLHFYWPFSTTAPPRAITTVDVVRIPFRAGVVRPGPVPPQMRALPEPGGGVASADGLRIDVAPVPAGLAQGTPQNAAERAAAALLSILRWKAGQWWIGHAHREFESPLRQWYPIDGQGRFVEGTVHVPVRIEPRMGFEVSITRELFAAAAEMATNEQQAPLHWETFLDAVFHFITSDAVPRAVVDAAMSCELAVENAVARLAAKRAATFDDLSRALSRGDLLANLRTAIPRLFSRSYPEECAEEFTSIQDLWVSRGSIVHGRLAGVDRRARVPNRESAAGMLTASQHLLSWLDDLATAV